MWSTVMAISLRVDPCHTGAVSPDREHRRTVLVTGAASGIGAACAAVLARAGWDVIATDRDATDRDGATRNERVPGASVITPLDVASESDWDRVVDEMFTKAGRSWDAVVSCAGIRSRGMIVDTSLADWERHLRVNLTGTWLGLRAFLRNVTRDRERGDTSPKSAVTIASVNATIAVPGQAHYVASKGGITALTRAAALEGAPLGVRVNGIAPGPIRTPMAAERLNDPDQVKWLTGRVPLGRVGEPDEIAEVVEFLLSSRASYVNGEIVYADGGWASNAV
jgi:NAD(P)-dependent dehydrogenase (short-subunit alcohol dehydrogenase family)